MKLHDNEIRDINRHLEAEKPLPEKYRVLLFEDKKEVELVWNGKTDIAKYKNTETTGLIISHWLSTRFTVEFMGVWEKIHNPDFNVTEFSNIKNESGSNGFVLTVKQWVQKPRAIGITSKPGRYGGTYAHKDIAFEFASWVSVEFKLYLIKEFQRLKDEEFKQLGWNIKRNLTKINYRIHTDAIKKHLIPPKLSKSQINFVYASEADVLNNVVINTGAPAV
ncbi:MAG: KilA-N domain-containing protein [Desulfobacula sp.]|nr:KilA-N domain-containing protein [Desulfobacula sp.]